MLLRFPTPQTDEIFYSVCARYHASMPMYSNENTSIDLFGKRSLVPSLVFPRELDFFVSQLNEETLLTQEYLIQHHTMLPLYSPFTESERVDRMIVLMRRGGRIMNSLGSLGFSPKYMKMRGLLRYCPKCIVSDIQEEKEVYWHRSHQCPGVRVCHKHGVWLEHSPYESIKASYKLPEKKWGGDGRGASDSQDFVRHQYLAVGTHWLLNQSIEAQGLETLLARYRWLLRERDLLTINGHCRNNKMIDSFVEYYGEPFLDGIGAGIDLKRHNSWLAKMMRGADRKVVHPCQHLLFMKFLGIGYQDFFTAHPVSDLPFGDGPWPCLNGAADHYRKKVVQRCKIEKQGTRIVGYFSCECGFTYRRIGPDRNETDHLRFDEIPKYGKVFLEQVRKMKEIEKLSAVKIAEVLGVSVYRVRNRIRSDYQEAHIKLSDEKKNILREQYREQFLQLIAMNPDKNRTELVYNRKSDPWIKWLYRYDKEWFLENAPPKVWVVRRKSLKDWNKIDKELSREVKDIVVKLRNENNNSRITIAGIIRKIGNDTYLSKKLHKLPLTSKTILTYLDTTPSYREKLIEMHGFPKSQFLL